MESSFTARFDDGKYFLSVNYDNGEAMESGSDSLDSYTLNKMAVARKSNSQVSEYGYVTETAFPTKNLLGTQIIWIGLGAFRNPDAELTMTWPLEVFEQYSDKSISMVLRRSKEFPEVPNQVKWLAPSFIMSGENQLSVEQYTNGWLGAEFEANGWTNFNGMRLPLEFTLKTYRPKLPATFTESQLRRTQQDVELVTTTSVLVTNLSPLIGEPSFLPALSAHVSVRDWRFKDKLKGESISYSIGDSRWPSRGNHLLLDLVNTHRAIDSKASETRPRLIRVALLFVVLALPILLIFNWVIKFKSQKKT